MTAGGRLIVLLALCPAIVAFSPTQPLPGASGHKTRPPLAAQRLWDVSDSLLPSALSADESSVSSRVNAASTSPPSPRKAAGTGLAVLAEEKASRASKSSALAPFRGSKGPARPVTKGRTADLFVPAGMLEMMVEWAEKLDSRIASGNSLIKPDKEQRLLMLAQVLRRLEQRRVELSQGQPSGAISMVELAESFNMQPHEVEVYYRLGLRARSYILMSLHDLIASLAAKYAAQYRMQQQELVQEGYRAVLKAIDKYDANKASLAGATFQTFAFPYIAYEMLGVARAEVGLLGPPQSARDESAVRPLLLPSQAAKAVAALPPGRTEVVEPDEVLDVDEIDDDEEEDDEDDEEVVVKGRRGRGSSMPGLARMKKHRLQRPAVRRVLMEAGGEEAMAPSAGGSGLFGVDPEQAKTPGQIMEEEQQTRDLTDFLSRAAKEMSPQDMQVLALSFGLNGHKPMKRMQVAEKLGLKASAVSRSKDRAIKKLREMLNVDRR